MFGTITFATLPKNYNFRHVRVNIHIYCKSGNSISLKLNMFIDTKVAKVSVARFVAKVIGGIYTSVVSRRVVRLNYKGRHKHGTRKYDGPTSYRTKSSYNRQINVKVRRNRHKLYDCTTKFVR